MPRTKYEFIKLELRLFNDYRYFSLNEFERLLYIYLIAFAKQTKNKIPKNGGVLATYLRTTRSETEIESAIRKIKGLFPKLKETKYFYYFDEWKERYHNVSLNGSLSEQNGGTDNRHRQKTKDKRQKTIDKLCADKLEIISFWNSQNIIVHRNIPPIPENLDRRLTKRLKEASVEKIKVGIENYAIVLNDPKNPPDSPKRFKWDYRWTLVEFLTRANAWEMFVEKDKKTVIYNFMLNTAIPEDVYKDYGVESEEQNGN